MTKINYCGILVIRFELMFVRKSPLNIMLRKKTQNTNEIPSGNNKIYFQFSKYPFKKTRKKFQN